MTAVRRTRDVKTLDRALSKAGVGSRGEARRWIAERRVEVNGRVVTDPVVWVDPDDAIAVDGRPVRPERRVYLLIHKPKGYVTTYGDPLGRKTVYDLLPRRDEYLFPVGRLDLDTSGLLILTNDSAFSEALTNPEHAMPKTYLVKASKPMGDEHLEALRRGVTLKDGPTRPARVRRSPASKSRSVFEITITEGRNRQVRRMVASQGAKVLRLVRTAIGSVVLGDLPAGGSRALTPDELRRLRRAKPA